MPILDIAIILIVLAGAALGFKRGLIAEAAYLISGIVSFVLASRLSTQFEPLILPYCGQNQLLAARLSFVFLFVAFLIALGLSAKYISKLVQFTPLGIINALGGALLGAIKTLALLAALSLLLKYLNWPAGKQAWEQESEIYSQLQSRSAQWLPDMLHTAQSGIEQIRSVSAEDTRP